MSETVQTIAAAILALSPQARYRLAAHLFDRNETTLAHVIIRSGIVDEPADETADTVPAPVCPMEMACITGAPTCDACVEVLT